MWSNFKLISAAVMGVDAEGAHTLCLLVLNEWMMEKDEARANEG